MLNPIVSLILGLVLPLITVQVIKRVLRNVFNIFGSQVVGKLPHGVQLGLGLAVAFVFASFAQVGFVPEFVKFADPISSAVIGLASKAIYDFIHDLKKPE